MLQAIEGGLARIPRWLRRLAWTLSIVFAPSCGGPAAVPVDPPLPSSMMAPPAATMVDDSSLSMTSADEVAAKRERLIEFLWGTGGLPRDKQPDEVDLAVANPVGMPSMPNLRRVDRLRIDMGQGVQNETFHFVPKRANGRLVVVHQGHDSLLTSAGVSDTIAELVGAGYGVLAGLMLCFNSLPCPVASSQITELHDDLIAQVQVPPEQGSVIKFFVEHLVVSMNYLRSAGARDDFPMYTEYDMIGLSGGGWTTVLYAAIDPAIRFSIPISGSMPMYLRRCPSCVDGYDGDREQSFGPLYELAGYLDLYALGAAGPQRRQVQVQIRHDSCCFGEDSYTDANAIPGLHWDQAVRAYERKLDTFFRSETDLGWFRFEIDETSIHQHTISPGTRVQVIFAELEGDRRPLAASSQTDVFAGDLAGNLASVLDAGAPFGSSVVGTPAVPGPADVLLRDESSHLVHLASAAGGWTREAWSDVVASDPAAVAGDDGLDAVAVGSDATLWHWAERGGQLAIEQVNAAVAVAGTPALVSGGAGLDAFARRADGGIHHFAWRPGSAWTSESIGPSIARGYPAAIARADGSLAVFVRGDDDAIWQISRAADGAEWSSTSLVDSNGQAPLGSGSPDVELSPSGNVIVVSRAAGGSMLVFDIAAGDAAFAPSLSTRGPPAGAPPAGTAGFVASPVAFDGGFFALGIEGNVWRTTFTGDWSFEGGVVR